MPVVIESRKPKAKGTRNQETFKRQHYRKQFEYRDEFQSTEKTCCHLIPCVVLCFSFLIKIMKWFPVAFSVSEIIVRGDLLSLNLKSKPIVITDIKTQWFQIIRMLRRVLEPWGKLLSLKFQWKPTVTTGTINESK